MFIVQLREGTYTKIYYCFPTSLILDTVRLRCILLILMDVMHVFSFIAQEARAVLLRDPNSIKDSLSFVYRAC